MKNGTRVFGSFQTLSPLVQSAPREFNERAPQGAPIETRKWRVPVSGEAGGQAAFIPVISGNSFRGRSRRAVAEDLCRTLGIEPKSMDPQVTHLIFVGGSLTKSVDNTLTPETRDDLRRLLPILSVFGGSVLGTMTEGLVSFGDWVAQVRETPEPCLIPDTDPEGLPTAGNIVDLQRYVQAAGILEDIYSNAEIKGLSEQLKEQAGEGGGLRQSMPYGIESVVPGVTFRGWVAVDARAGEVERAALRKAIDLAFPPQDGSVREVFLGGGANRGYGLVRLELDLTEIAPDTRAYDEHLASVAAEAKAYLLSRKLVPTQKAKPEQKAKLPAAAAK